MRRLLELAAARDRRHDRLAWWCALFTAPVSLQVDEIGDVLELTGGVRAAAAEHGRTATAPARAGVHKLKDRLLLVLDMARRDRRDVEWRTTEKETTMTTRENRNQCGGAGATAAKQCRWRRSQGRRISRQRRPSQPPRSRPGNPLRPVRHRRGQPRACAANSSGSPRTTGSC